MTLVERLVRCWSPSGSEQEIAELLISEMRARGFRTSIDAAGNAIGAVGVGPNKLFLVGHMDTVLGEIPVRVEDGVLYGRGSVDAKGSLACFIEVASNFVVSEDLEVIVFGCVREETDSRGAHQVLQDWPSPDAVVIGEPSGWDALTLGYKGSLSMSFQCERGGAHTGAYQKTPAEEAFQFYCELQDSFSNIGTSFDELSINLKEINTSSDGIYDKVEMNLNLRPPLDFDLQLLTEIAKDLAGSNCLEIGEFTAAVLASKNNALVRSFLASMSSRDLRPKFKKKTGTSDMNLLQSYDCPILAYGPGDSKLDHTPDEQLRLDEFEKAIEVLTDAISHFANA